MGTVPDLDTVRGYVRVPASSLSDEDLERMRLAALDDQTRRCVYDNPDNDPDAYPDALAQALLRRVQREIAARNLPLGMVGLEAEYGPANIPAYDALIEHHENAYRRVILA